MTARFSAFANTVPGGTPYKAGVVVFGKSVFVVSYRKTVRFIKEGERLLLVLS